AACRVAVVATAGSVAGRGWRACPPRCSVQEVAVTPTVIATTHVLFIQPQGSTAPSSSFSSVSADSPPRRDVTLFQCQTDCSLFYTTAIPAANCQAHYCLSVDLLPGEGL